MSNIKMIDQHGNPMTFTVKRDGLTDGIRPVPRGERVRFSIRTNYIAYRVNDIRVADPEVWQVCDIHVQGRSQMPHTIGDNIFGAVGFRGHSAPSLRGDGVMATDLPPGIIEETVQTAMELKIDVIYRGSSPLGGDFGCEMRCTVAL